MISSTRNFNLLTAFLSGAIFSIACIAMPARVSAQCANDNNYETTAGAPPCGSDASVSLGAGTYAEVPVIANANYTFNTCGTSWNTQLTGYNGASVFSEFFNDDACGSQSSVTWTSTFTGTLRIMIDNFDCDPCNAPPLVTPTDCPALGSAVLFYRQNNNLTFTSSNAPMCGGAARTLTATPAGGGFFGTGVSGSTFTAPNMDSAFSIIYSFAQCLATQTISTFMNPTTGLSISNFHNAGTIDPCDSYTHSDNNRCYPNSTGNPGNDVWYRIIVPYPMTLTITTCAGTTLDSYLRLYNSGGSQLTFDDNFCAPQSQIIYNAPAGTYFVIVEGAGSAIGAYTLSITGTGSDIKNTWYGRYDSDWNNNCNWSMGHKPTSAEDVYIPGSSAYVNKPIIFDGITGTCNTIEINSDAGGELEIAGTTGKLDVLQP